MAKKKAGDNFFAELATATGGDILEDIGSVKYFVDTGNLSINYICSGKFMGGGIPGGKITEIYGPPGGGKSLIANCILAGVQKLGGIGVFLDCERALNAMFAETAAHVDTSKIVTYTPRFIEEVESKVKAVVKLIRKVKGKDVPIVIIWDSISVSPCHREFKELDLPEVYTKADFKRIVGGKEQPGERAKVAGAALRKLNPFLDENNATFFVINQTRSTIGGNPAFSEVTGGGGQALPFYASCRLRVSATKKFVDENELQCGINLQVRNKKNRSFVPFLEASNVQLFYDKGINPLGGLLLILLQISRVEPAGGGGNYIVKEPWANGQKVKFKAAKEANIVPADVLYRCPTLVDAESKEEVEAYLSIFQDAIDLTEADTLQSKDVNDESSNMDDVMDSE